jgi:hypothetical protein
MRKPNSNAKLKTLPEERQAAIAEYALDKSLAETVKWLREDGLVTSSAAVSEFLSWYRLKEQLAKNETTVSQMLEEIKQNDPSITQSQLEQAGQAFFSALAIEQQDSLTWKRVQDAKLRLGVLKLNRDKFEFDAATACLKQLPELKAISTNKALSETQKVEQIRLKLFGAVPPAQST